MKNLSNQKSCCSQTNLKKNKKGFCIGILYGILPHTFCIAFILFSVIGATTATIFFKKFLLNPYFFHILIGISFIFATLSALLYLKRNGILSIQGVKRKWRYLFTLYGTTIFINLVLFLVIFPIVANLNSGSSLAAAIITAFGGQGTELTDSGSLLTLKVNIPCPGHAPLIIDELKGIEGVKVVKFKFPNLFDVVYDSERTSKQLILSLEVFNIYKATVIEEITNLTSNNQNDLQPLNNSNQSRINTDTRRNSCTVGCGGVNQGCGCGCGQR